MGMVDGFGDLGYQLGDHSGLILKPSTALLEILPIDQLHAVIALAAFLADIEDRHDGGVIERRDGFRLTLEQADFPIGGEAYRS